MVTFQYNNGKQQKMARVYADILVKLKQGSIVGAIEESRPKRRRYTRRDMRAED